MLIANSENTAVGAPFHRQHLSRLYAGIYVRWFENLRLIMRTGGSRMVDDYNVTAGSVFGV
jgi:hypothetical protein